MGIASFSQSPVLSVLRAPWQTLAAWFVPTQPTPHPFAVPAAAQRTPHPLAQPFVSGGTAACRRAKAHTATDLSGPRAPKKMTAHSCLKVVREFDSAVSPACAGRMVISGRMADVCAELERMAQREIAAH